MYFAFAIVSRTLLFYFGDDRFLKFQLIRVALFEQVISVGFFGVFPDECYDGRKGDNR